MRFIFVYRIFNAGWVVIYSFTKAVRTNQKYGNILIGLPPHLKTHITFTEFNQHVYIPELGWVSLLICIGDMITYRKTDLLL